MFHQGIPFFVPQFQLLSKKRCQTCHNPITWVVFNKYPNTDYCSKKCIPTYIPNSPLLSDEQCQTCHHAIPFSVLKKYPTARYCSKTCIPHNSHNNNNHKKHHNFNCNCNVCYRYSSVGSNGYPATGVGVVIYFTYGKGSIRNVEVVILGREKYGDYKHQYNIVAGKREKNECILETAVREVKEELKIDISKQDLINSHSELIGKTPVFFVKIQSGISRQTLNFNVTSDLSNMNLPYSYKEIDHIDYFKISDASQLNGKNAVVSSFAMSAISLLRNRLW